jgi:two-component system, OmpR family, phosphate regulon sensor histidine kinase PhoR
VSPPRRLALVVGGAALAAALVALLALQWQQQAALRSSKDARLAEVAATLAPRAAGLLSRPTVDAYEAIHGWSTASGFRVTLIGPHGTVHADSATHPDLVGQMENHGSRPEVVAARRSGEAMSRRRSATTNRVTTYVARRLGDADRPAGWLRIAWEEPRLPFPWGGLATAILIAAVAALVARTWLSRWQLAVGRHLAGWSDLPAGEDIEALAQDADRHFRALRDELDNELAVTRAALGQIGEGVVLLDGQMTVHFANAAARTLLGEELSEGKPLLDSIRAPELLAAANEALESGEATHTSLSSREGIELAVRVSPLPHWLLRLAVVLRDVSGERRLERARRALVADLAHEMRTPLTVLGGLAEELREAGGGGELVPVLERQVRRLATFAGELEELARIESGQLRLEVEEVDLQTIARGVLADFHRRAEEAGITLRQEGHTAAITSDPVRLAQLLTNLVDNAIRYNRPGGEVVVSTSWDAGVAHLSVKDTGLGIPATDLPLVFQRFFRVRRSGQAESGSGLGLAIVKHLTRALRGTVHLTSREGEGTQVTLLFPATPEVATNLPPATA